MVCAAALDPLIHSITGNYNVEVGSGGYTLLFMGINLLSNWYSKLHVAVRCITGLCHLL